MGKIVQKQQPQRQLRSTGSNASALKKSTDINCNINTSVRKRIPNTVRKTLPSKTKSQGTKISSKAQGRKNGNLKKTGTVKIPKARVQSPSKKHTSTIPSSSPRNKETVQNLTKTDNSVHLTTNNDTSELNASNVSTPPRHKATKNSSTKSSKKKAVRKSNGKPKQSTITTLNDNPNRVIKHRKRRVVPPSNRILRERKKTDYTLPEACLMQIRDILSSARKSRKLGKTPVKSPEEGFTTPKSSKSNKRQVSPSKLSPRKLKF